MLRALTAADLPGEDGAHPHEDPTATPADRRRERAPRTAAPEIPADPAARRDRARRRLVRALSRSGLSITEARRRLAADGLEPAEIDEVVAEFADRGWLDDAAVADQIVYAGAARKGQGRLAIARTLAQRGVPREVADAALDQLDDDDDRERASAFARTRARSLRGVDHDTALRRLVGQLARRGYGGGVAFEAARRALDEL